MSGVSSLPGEGDEEAGEILGFGWGFLRTAAFFQSALFGILFHETRSVRESVQKVCIETGRELRLERVCGSCQFREPQKTCHWQLLCALRQFLTFLIFAHDKMRAIGEKRNENLQARCAQIGEFPL